jgi:hypothetical protein
LSPITSLLFLLSETSSRSVVSCCNHSKPIIINCNLAYFSKSVNYSLQEKEHTKDCFLIFMHEESLISLNLHTTRGMLCLPYSHSFYTFVYSGSKASRTLAA